MSVQATNTFHTKPGRGTDLIAALRQALPDMLKHGGCEQIQLWQDQDDPNLVVSATRWIIRGHYASYLEWRDGRGDTATFRELLVKVRKNIVAIPVRRSGPIRYARAGRFEPPRPVSADPAEVVPVSVCPQPPSRLDAVMGPPPPHDTPAQDEDCLKLAVVGPADTDDR